MTTSAGPGTPGRPHSLAPAHLGDVRAGAALAATVLGVAVFITGIGIVVGGLTASAGYDPANPPPNADSLGSWQVIGGFALFTVGLALAGGGLALLAGGRRIRVPTAVLSLIAAVAAIAGGVAIVARGPSDMVLAVSLFGLGLVLGSAGLLLLRPRP